MARALRVEYPGAFYHVINRGNVSNEVASMIEALVQNKFDKKSER